MEDSRMACWNGPCRRPGTCAVGWGRKRRRPCGEAIDPERAGHRADRSACGNAGRAGWAAGRKGAEQRGSARRAVLLGRAQRIALPGACVRDGQRKPATGAAIHGDGPGSVTGGKSGGTPSKRDGILRSLRSLRMTASSSESLRRAAPCQDGTGAAGGGYELAVGTTRIGTVTRWRTPSTVVPWTKSPTPRWPWLPRTRMSGVCCWTRLASWTAGWP